MPMTKVLRCNDLMPGCKWEGRGYSEAEVLMKAAEHAKAVHLADITPEMISKIRGAIRDEDQAQAQKVGS
jgi:predicted small metal-binding protein